LVEFRLIGLGGSLTVKDRR